MPGDFIQDVPKAKDENPGLTGLVQDLQREQQKNKEKPADKPIIVGPGPIYKAKNGEHVIATEGSIVDAEKGSYVEAKNGSKVTALGGSKVDATEGSFVAAEAGSHVHAHEGSIIFAHKDSKVNLLGGEVTAGEGCVIEADRGKVIAYDGSIVTAKKGAEVSCLGGNVTALEGSKVRVSNGHVLAKEGSQVEAAALNGMTSSIIVEGGKVRAEGFDPPKADLNNADKNAPKYAINITIKDGFPTSNVYAQGSVKIDAHAGSVMAGKDTMTIAHANSTVYALMGSHVIAKAGSKVIATKKDSIDKAEPGSKIEIRIKDKSKEPMA